MWIIHEPKKVALWNKRHFEEKNGECEACMLKKIYKMQHLEGSGTPVLYIGCMVLKGKSTLRFYISMLSGRRVQTLPKKFRQPTIPQIASRKCYHKILWHSFKSNSPRNRNISNRHVRISRHTLPYLPVHFNTPQVWILSSLPTGLGLYYKNMNTSEMTTINKFITN